MSVAVRQVVGVKSRSTRKGIVHESKTLSIFGHVLVFGLLLGAASTVMTDNFGIFAHAAITDSLNLNGVPVFSTDEMLTEVGA